MTRLRLSAAFSRNRLTAPILSGQVTPEGIDWACSAVHPSEMFWRQLRYGDFDVSEMSLASLYIATAQGRRDWVAIPVFATRRFFHTAILVRADAGVAAPQDLVGRRVGVPEYQQTAAVWTRGALRHEFGVLPEQLHWFMERVPERSHGAATGFTPPAGLDFDYIPPDSSISAALRDGRLDAALMNITDRNLVDRSRDAAGDPGAIGHLFPDPVAEGLRYHRATGLLPVNHCLVVRADLAREHPWTTLNIYAAFLRAKEQALQDALGALEGWTTVGAIDAAAARSLEATDPLPYGLAAQPEVFQTLATYLLEQGLVDREVRPGEVFAANTLDL